MPAAERLQPGSERERLWAALLELLAERDYDSITPARVLQRAGLPPAAFERHFSDLDDCAAALWGKIDAELSALVDDAYRDGEEWTDRLRRALLAGLCYLAANPARARLYLTEAQRLSNSLQRRQLDSVRRLGVLIQRGAEQPQGPVEAPSEEIAEAIAGAIFYRAAKLVRAGESAGLPGLLQELMYVALLPYRGAEAAEAELRLA